MKLIFDWNRIWRAAEMGFSACLWELVSACLAKNWHWARIIEHSSCPFMMQKFLTFFHRWLDITPESNFQPKGITTSELNQQEWFVILNQFGLRATYSIALDLGMYVNKWCWWEHRAIYNLLMGSKFNVKWCPVKWLFVQFSLVFSPGFIVCSVSGWQSIKDLLLIIISGSPRVTLLDFPPFVSKCPFFFIQNCIHETILKKLPKNIT